MCESDKVDSFLVIYFVCASHVFSAQCFPSQAGAWEGDRDSGTWEVGRERNLAKLRHSPEWQKSRESFRSLL